LTHDCLESNMAQALSEMQSDTSVLAPIVQIRKEELS